MFLQIKYLMQGKAQFVNWCILTFWAEWKITCYHHHHDDHLKMTVFRWNSLISLLCKNSLHCSRREMWQ